MNTSKYFAIAAIALLAGITTSTIVNQAFADNPNTKEDRCQPRSEFNGKENSGNEHFNGDGSFDQEKNPHDLDANGDPKVGNPHDRCVGS